MTIFKWFKDQIMKLAVWWPNEQNAQVLLYLAGLVRLNKFCILNYIILDTSFFMLYAEVIILKLILDLDERTVQNIQGYATEKGINPSQIIETLFNSYIQEPAEAIEEYGLENIQKFEILITEYMNEAIYDIEELANSTEANEDDSKMANVFRKLNRDHLKNAALLTDLYKEYKGR